MASQIFKPSSPDWLVAEMPPGYQTRYTEIQRLSAEIEAMDRIGRLLWEVGPALAEATREMFAALKIESNPVPANETSAVAVKLDAKRRLLLHVAGSEETIQKKSDEIARTFQLMHEFSGDDDRVVFVSNHDRLVHPKERSSPISSEALSLLRRMGVNFLPGPSLFDLWILGQKDSAKARAALEQVHGQDGGIFVAATRG